MDPLMVGIRRTALDDNRERIVIDGELAPLDESKYGWVLSMLGPPTREMVTPAKGDIVSMQISARGGLLVAVDSAALSVPRRAGHGPARRFAADGPACRRCK